MTENVTCERCAVIVPRVYTVIHPETHEVKHCCDACERRLVQAIRTLRRMRRGDE